MKIPPSPSVWLNVGFVFLGSLLLAVVSAEWVAPSNTLFGETPLWGQTICAALGLIAVGVGILSSDSVRRIMARHRNEVPPRGVSRWGEYYKE